MSAIAALRLVHAEREALLEVEVHVLVVVVRVADRDVLAALEDEVAAAEADDEAVLSARAPHDRSAEDAPHVVEDGIAAVLGRLDDTGVLGRAERRSRTGR